MSSRLKKRRAKRGRRRSSSRWIPLEKAEADPSLTGKHRVQMSGCPVSGEQFVRPIVGRYQGRPRAELRWRIDFVKDRLAELGLEGQLGASGPLWLQLEFLENVLEFEINPPCACAQDRRGRGGPQAAG